MYSIRFEYITRHNIAVSPELSRVEVCITVMQVYIGATAWTTRNNNNITILWCNRPKVERQLFWE